MRDHSFTSTRRAAEEGSALLVVIMISVILTLLGLSYLAVASQENSIAINQRDADQLTFVAEAGAKMVKAWFDRPVEGDPNSPIFKFMGDYDLRRVKYYDRTQRLFDHDGDPNTAEVLADGSSGKPYFRQGLQVSSDPNFLAFWNKPYRGSKESEFRGLESGPDIVMESDPNGLDFLDIVNQRVISANRTVQETVGRIQKIEVYGPPVIEVGGVRTRFGIATVKVTSAKFKYMGNIGAVPVTTASSVEVGRQVAKMVLNEVPYPGPAGPFQSCLDFQTNGNVEIHWGEIHSQTTANVGGGASNLKDRTPPSIPLANPSNYISGSLLTRYQIHNDGQTGDSAKNLWFDPWFRIRAGGALTGAPPGVQQPYPYVGDANSAPDIEDDDSNLLAYSPPTCPDFAYSIWKNVAKSGGKNVHYMVYAGSADSYREDGTGTAQGLKAWTNGQTGFWFFDTVDRLPPDPNGTNLGGAISLSGNWNSAGFIYLNARWDSSGLAAGGGANRVIIPPGEPWYDADGDGVADPGEYTNLQYPTAISGGQFYVKAPDPNGPVQSSTVTTANGITYSYSTQPDARDDQGLPFLGSIQFQGVIYATGSFEATGNMVVFGSVVAKGGMQTGGAGPTAGTPLVLFDERLIKGGWPPPELELPRTMITFWETDM